MSSINYNKKKIALVDCNSFYVSCERLFNPKIQNKPVVVLSNNEYEIIEHKEMQKLVIWINLFFTTDVDKHVSPKDRKE